MSHIQVLETVGLSKVPLSSRQIEKEIEGNDKTNTDIYRIVRELGGMSTVQVVKLFSLNDILENKDDVEFRRKLIMTLNRIYGLDLKLADKYDTTANDKLIQIKVIKSDTGNPSDTGEIPTIIVHHYTQEHTEIIICTLNQQESQRKSTVNTYDPINSPVSGTTFLVIKKNDKIARIHELVSHRKLNDNNDVTFSSKGIIRNRTKFLKYTLKDIKQKEVELLQAEKKLVADLNKLTNIGHDYFTIINMTEEDETNLKKISIIGSKTRNYRYNLTVKGLLLYLQGHSERPQLDKSTRRKANTNTSKMLVNLSKYYIDDFPFLSYYQSLEKILGRRFMVQLFEQIASELRTNLTVPISILLDII